MSDENVVTSGSLILGAGGGGLSGAGVVLVSAGFAAGGILKHGS